MGGRERNGVMLCVSACVYVCVGWRAGGGGQAQSVLITATVGGG